MLKPEEIEILRESALLVSKTLTEVAKIIKPGIKTIELDTLAETFIRDHQGVPAFKGYGDKRNPFPYSLCISVNEMVVHGMPSDYEIQDGDIVSVDCGVFKNGFCGDHAYTFAVGDVDEAGMKLIAVTKESLYRGIEQAKAGNRTGDIGYAIESFTHGEHGYGVVRELVGHSIGRRMHEDLQIPNYGKRGNGKKLPENIVLAIEPMINMGTRHVEFLDDGWSVVTADGKPSVHFEHNVWVKKNGYEILSDYSIIEAAEKANPDLKTLS